MSHPLPSQETRAQAMLADIQQRLDDVPLLGRHAGAIIILVMVGLAIYGVAALVCALAGLRALGLEVLLGWGLVSGLGVWLARKDRALATPRRRGLVALLVLAGLVVGLWVQAPWLLAVLVGLWVLSWAWMREVVRKLRAMETLSADTGHPAQDEEVDGLGEGDQAQG